ncbi:6820_t:CDS:2 [Cetraspora pellucida]|uniref:6820_t:CDS:1 n=1 Tax=Cetraspora pellucida TaxID=1433469 RepID=A0A9N9JFM6_9GLOM|nr:6820_t:CDS:2 [Cetraspora pellucida]
MVSELIQKYLGDGPKLVRKLFRVAEEHALSIVFIDEFDAIGTKRGEREIQITMLELLNQLDGFDSRGDVKDLEEFVMSKDDLSDADIKSICTEADLLALRERRMKVIAEDFRKAYEKVFYCKSEGTAEGLLYL